MVSVGAVTMLAAALVALPVAASPRTPTVGLSASQGARQPAALTIQPYDWPTYLRNQQHSSGNFSVPGITLGNVSKLRTLWSWSAPVSGDNLLASPTIAAGMVFLGTTSGRIYALNELTGSAIWSKQLDVVPAKLGGCNQSTGISGTASVAPDPRTGLLTVYVAGGRFLYALDAATGAQRWRALVGPANSLNTVGYRNWASPTVAGGVVLMGLSSNCDAPLIRGGVQAFNQATGATTGSYFTVPAGKVGGSVWSSVASDGKSAWVTTGNPDPRGTHVYDSYSIVRLVLPGLVKVDKSTVTLPITADKDFGSSPTLFAAILRGTTTLMVGACNKNGVYYAWRSGNLAAGPVWHDQVGNTSNEPDMCLTSGAWDFPRNELYIAANSTTINGKKVAGSVRQVDPATGAYHWQTALPCVPLVSPSLNGSSNLLAVSTWCTSGTSRTYVLNAANGAIVASYVQPSETFVQPVWSASALFIGGSFGPGKLVVLF
jgi:hypothetical protein